MQTTPPPELTGPRTPPTDPMLQLFQYKHLPPEKQTISKKFHDLALELVETLPSNRERSTALRKLREAKDCAVTASFFQEGARE